MNFLKLFEALNLLFLKYFSVTVKEMFSFLVFGGVGVTAAFAVSLGVVLEIAFISESEILGSALLGVTSWTTQALKGQKFSSENTIKEGVTLIIN